MKERIRKNAEVRRQIKWEKIWVNDVNEKKRMTGFEGEWDMELYKIKGMKENEERTRIGKIVLGKGLPI